MGLNQESTSVGSFIPAGGLSRTLFLKETFSNGFTFYNLKPFMSKVSSSGTFSTVWVQSTWPLFYGTNLFNNCSCFLCLYLFGSQQETCSWSNCVFFKSLYTVLCVCVCVWFFLSHDSQCKPDQKQLTITMSQPEFYVVVKFYPSNKLIHYV